MREREIERERDRERERIGKKYVKLIEIKTRTYFRFCFLVPLFMFTKTPFSEKILKL